MVRDFLQKLADSGYSHTLRMDIIKSGCRIYCRREIEDRTGGRPLYRTAEQMGAARMVKRFQNQSWFKTSRGGRNLTPRKDLPHKLQETELGKRLRQEMRSNNVRGEGGTSPEKKETKSSQEAEVGNKTVKEIEAVLFVPYSEG